MSTDLVVSDDVPARIPRVVELFESMAPIRKDARTVMLNVTRLLPDGQGLWTMAQAVRTDGKSRTKVVLVLTATQLLIVDEWSGRVQDFLLEDVRCAEFAKDFWRGTKMRLQTPAGEWTLKQLLPLDEGVRIAIACGLDIETGMDTTLVGGGSPVGPMCPPLAYGPEMILYPDRIVHAYRHLPFNGPVQATIDTAGNIAVTRGRNLAAKGAGTLLLGPVGLFMMGNAKERTTDNRELYVLVEGPEWAVTVQLDPDAASSAREFVSQINVAARRWRRAQERDLGPDGIADQLSKLAELKASGALSAEEFAAAKARVLGGDS